MTNVSAVLSRRALVPAGEVRMLMSKRRRAAGSRVPIKPPLTSPSLPSRPSWQGWRNNIDLLDLPLSLRFSPRRRGGELVSLKGTWLREGEGQGRPREMFSPIDYNKCRERNAQTSPPPSLFSLRAGSLLAVKAELVPAWFSTGV